MIPKIWQVSIFSVALLAFGCKHSSRLHPESVIQSTEIITAREHYSPEAFSNALHLAIATMKDKSLLEFGVHLLIDITNTIDGWSIRFSDGERGNTSHTLLFVPNAPNNLPEPTVAVVLESTAGGGTQWHFRRGEKFAHAAMKALDLVLKTFEFATSSELFLSAYETKETLHFVFRFPPYETHMGVAVAVDSEGSPRIVRSGL